MRLMTLTAILAGTSSLCAVVAVADETRSQAIQSVIAEQLQAFQADDFDRAFTYASPNIKRLFGSPQRFGQMVRQGYPMVWRPAEVDYLGLREDTGRPTQRVMIRDAAGALHVLDYEMIETPEGWQINGVRVLPAGGIGA